jgi:hypothetical protein
LRRRGLPEEARVTRQDADVAREVNFTLNKACQSYGRTCFQKNASSNAFVVFQAQSVQSTSAVTFKTEAIAMFALLVLPMLVGIIAAMVLPHVLK